MTKRRPSIKGRGAEILFGEPPPPEAPPLEGDAGNWPAGAPLPEAAAEISLPEGEQLFPEGESMAAVEDSAPPEGEAMDETEILPPMLESMAESEITGLPGEPVGAPESTLPELVPDWFEPGPHAPEAVPAAEAAAEAGDQVPPEPEPAPAAENLPDVEAIPSDALRELHAGTDVEGAAAAEGRLPGVPAGPVPGAPVDSTAEGAGGPLVEGLVEPRPAGDVAVPAAASDAGAQPALAAASSDQAGLESALREEARDGEPLVPPSLEGIDLDGELPGGEEFPPITPEMEAAFITEAGASEEPPEPVADLPSPTLEATMDERDATTSTAIHQPPPPETDGDVTHGVEPPRRVTPVFTLPAGAAMATADIQEGAGVRPEEINPVLTPEQQKAVLEQITQAKLLKLDQAIEDTYHDVIKVVGDNADLTNECYNLLLKARDTIWRRDAGRIAQAEYYLQQVQARLRRARDSETEASHYQWRILAWGGLWGILLVGALVLQGQAWFRDAVMPAPANDMLIDMRVFVPAMLWGGIGGVTAVLYSLFKHVGQRDFDKAYNLSYVGKPFLGAILGVAVYMAFTLLMRTLYILPAGLSGGTASAPAIAPQIIYLFAWAGGFKENRVLDLMDRVMKQLFSGGEDETPPAAAAATTTVIVPGGEGTTPT